MTAIIIKYLITVIGGYLLGSLSTSIFISRSVLGGDVRKQGSGNAGATNMARIYGMVPGILTLLGDALKAATAMIIGKLLLGDGGIAAGGIAVLLGHCFPVLHHFKGGKGVSVGASIALMVDWRVFLTVLAVFLVSALLTKKVSVGSVCAAVFIGVAAWAFDVSAPKLALCIAGGIIVVFQHRENIKRLISGKEPDFKAARPHIPEIMKKKKKSYKPE